MKLYEINDKDRQVLIDVVALLKEAIEKVASEENINQGHGDFVIRPAYTSIQAQRLCQETIWAVNERLKQG